MLDRNHRVRAIGYAEECLARLKFGVRQQYRVHYFTANKQSIPVLPMSASAPLLRGDQLCESFLVNGQIDIRVFRPLEWAAINNRRIQGT